MNLDSTARQLHRERARRTQQKKRRVKSLQMARVIARHLRGKGEQRYD